ncbi:MAG: peptidoglycan-binding protein [Clostridia bacterium]
MKTLICPFVRTLHKSALCLMLTLALLASAVICPTPAFAEELGTVNTKVILRKAADKESKALQTLPEGEEVTLLNTSGDWYKVSYGVYTGYIMKKYIKTSSKLSNSSSSNSAAKIKAIGDPPGAMRIGDNNSDVKKLQQALKILNFYDGKLDGDYGNGTTNAVMKYQTAHKLENDGVAGRDTVKSIFGSCAKTSMTTQPSPTERASGSKDSASSNKGDSGSSGHKTVTSIAQIGSAPSATKEGDSGTNVVKLQQALECLGYYSGTIDGKYGAGTVSAVKRLQKKRNMNEDGIAGAATIRVLFGENASSDSSSSSKKYKTEVLDWFADNVSSVIPKNAKFTVKDVKTGKTFQAVRWSGINHLDAEPRTSEDTATLKSIYGGDWSWNRRPILILYNGHVYAASMNGMPHGTTTISNGFEGHFCIHFKNSMTHGTKKIDSDHQSAVTAASRAAW